MERKHGWGKKEEEACVCFRVLGGRDRVCDGLFGHMEVMFGLDGTEMSILVCGGA